MIHCSDFDSINDIDNENNDYFHTIFMYKESQMYTVDLSRNIPNRNLLSIDVKRYGRKCDYCLSLKQSNLKL